MRRETGAYRRLFTVADPPVLDANRDGWYALELPMAYSRLLKVTQDGRPVLVTAGPVGQLFAFTDRPSVPVEASYQLPTIALAATLLGWLVLVVAALPQRLRLMRRPSSMSRAGRPLLPAVAAQAASPGQSFLRFWNEHIGPRLFSGTRRILALRLETLVAPSFVLMALAVVAWAMSDYGLAWTQSEIYIKRATHPFEMVTFEWRGFARLFDCELVNECGRSRYLSPLFYYLSSVVRVWLLNYVPPHPSLSLTWPLSLASIALVYRTIVDWTRDRTAARLGVGLYMLSGGFL